MDALQQLALAYSKRRRYPLGDKIPIFRHDPDYRPLPPAQPRPPMAKSLVPDGAPMHPVLGGGRRRHLVMPIFKPRRPRRS